MNVSDVPRQLSLWDLMPRIWSSKSVRPAPNPVLRGSLFGLIQKGKDETLKDYVVYKDKDMSVTYDGVALGQADLDVWLCLIQKVGQRFMDASTKTVALELRPSLFMREIGRTGGKSGRIGKNDREWLVKSLKRLTGIITIKTTDNRKGILGGLVKSAAWNDDQDRLVVEIDNTVGYLFSGGYSQMSLSVRKTLMGDDLSLWLQAFIASHRVAGSDLFYSLDVLIERCRSHCGETRKFKYRVTEKMQRLMTLSERQRGFYHWLWQGETLMVFFSERRFQLWIYDNPTVPVPALPEIQSKEENSAFLPLE